MTAENNGGRTGYYDLPLPDRSLLYKLLERHVPRKELLGDIIADIIELCPQTLNDLIEAKNMQPWQHEIMKACYAIDARAEKNGGSRVREHNKIDYYNKRGKALSEKME
jgi:hypothetical protein